VWGSDYPMLDPGQILDEFSAMGLEGQKEQNVLKDNAARLLNLTL
jgi:predicted TIM-barrel fold metal-dependent hydrolase